MRLFLSLLLTLLLSAGSLSCKKENNGQINANRSDFTGTWKGELVTYSYGHKIVQKYIWVVYTNQSNGRLEGLLTMHETNKLEEIQFSDGKWFFRIVNSDSLNPQCREWSFAGFAGFNSEGVVEFNLAGNKCGPIGDQFVEWGGTMTKVSDGLDPDNHFGFIKDGNSWNYKITRNNQDTCALNYQVGALTPTGTYKGTMTNQCDWNWAEKQFSWAIDPGRFTVLTEETTKLPSTVFTLDMITDKIYHFRDGEAVTSTVLLKRNELVNVPAGKFTCNKYQVETNYDGDLQSGNIVSYYWISNRYGIIKREVLNPADSTSLKYQVLTSKNF